MSTNKIKESQMNEFRGWRAVFGCTKEALALYRIVLGTLLLCELSLRFRFLHPFYSDDGTLPLELLMPKVDTLYTAMCLHCRFGSELAQQVFLSLQCICAFLFTIGYQTRVMSILSWFLYLSLTLRNTWLNFILDRYIHYLLFYSMFLPLDECFSVTRSKKKNNDIVLTLATIALKLQITWIYLDAGSGKYMDPLGGWTYNADPLPALDTYARHTVAARYLYALLQPEGLRIMTPIVVYVELLSAPLALLGTYFGWTNFVFIVAGAICSLHLGIAFTLNNTILLSLVACAPWAAFLPLKAAEVTKTSSGNKRASTAPFKKMISRVSILSLIAGSLWFETLSEECNQSMKHIWSTLLHNRWNVFVGAEEYVTWEIAPGRLQDDSVVDVWGRMEIVNWRMPGAGAPSTSTARPGRWRSFPYLAELEGEEGEALWSYLCRQWDRENDVVNNEGRKLLRYNFFMLQAHVLPNMGFTATRKRLIKAYECEGTSDARSETEPGQVEGQVVNSSARAIDEKEL